MVHAPLLLSLFARERGLYCFPGFCFSRGKHSIAWKEIIRSRASGLFKFAVLKYVLKCCLIRYMNKRLTTDMADANGLQSDASPDFSTSRKWPPIFAAHKHMDNTGSLTIVLTQEEQCCYSNSPTLYQHGFTSLQNKT